MNKKNTLIIIGKRTNKTKKEFKLINNFINDNQNLTSWIGT